MPLAWSAVLILTVGAAPAAPTKVPPVPPPVPALPAPAPQAWPTPQTAPPPPSRVQAPRTAPTYGPVVQALLESHNAYRARRGLTPLRIDPALQRAAQGHADAMASHRKMSHRGLSGEAGGHVARARAAGYPSSRAAENIAAGATSVEQVMRGWFRSPGHHANIMGRGYTDVGLAVSRDSRGAPYWCAVFGGR